MSNNLWPPLHGPLVHYISQRPAEEFCQKIPRSLVVLGSTGSIGRNALAVVEQKTDFFQVKGLAAGRNVELLAKQALLYKPSVLAVYDDYYARKLREILPASYQPFIVSGSRGYAYLASLEDVDCVLSAQSGAAGVAGSLAAVLAGKVVALANKESIALGGGLFRHLCAKHKAVILPVDSEHHAIFQCLIGALAPAQKIILTASGGPFRNMDEEELKRMTAREALKHPNWNMGRKITIDSATMMNKGFEIIEASGLFGVTVEDIETVIHPQSIIHSLVQFTDGSLLAQMAVPDMKLPIADCLLWPHLDQSFVKPLDLFNLPPLTFSRPDVKKFPCLELAKRAFVHDSLPEWQAIGIKEACIILNAANEVAVDLFLDNACGFCDIPVIIEETLNKLLEQPDKPVPAEQRTNVVDQALAYAAVINQLDQKARDYARYIAAEIAKSKQY